MLKTNFAITTEKIINVKQGEKKDTKNYLSIY